MKYIALLTAMAALAAVEKKAEFEVASIKVAKDDGGHDVDVDKGLLRIHNLTLKRLIADAYQIDPSLVSGGPNWLDSDTYDITAKIPAEYVGLNPSKEPEMLQGLLADRFQLAIHREQRQVSGFALSVAKGGPKMEHAKPGAEDSSTRGTSTASGMHLKAINVSMEQLAMRLSRYAEIGRLVVDKTGLTGTFDFDLDWLPERAGIKPETPSDDDLPTIFVALQKQLGLKLESAKVPIDAVVVDRAEKADGN